MAVGEGQGWFVQPLIVLIVGFVVEAVCRAFVPCWLVLWRRTGVGVGSNGERERSES
jgi:hypothetical protein